MIVSMESGLEGRNNPHEPHQHRRYPPSVSMESGLEGRNNAIAAEARAADKSVSMESGLEGRNNPAQVADRLMQLRSQWSPA